MTRLLGYNKYGAKKVSQDGYTFDSKREHERYTELKLLEARGLISDLRVHVRYPLFCFDRGGNVREVAQYESDFDYFDVATARDIIEDCKGHRTAMYKLKKKWLELQSGVTIYET